MPTRDHPAKTYDSCALPPVPPRTRLCREWPVALVENLFGARPIVLSNQWGSRWSPRFPRAQSRRSTLARERCPHISGFQDHRIRTIELLSLYPPNPSSVLGVARRGDSFSLLRDSSGSYLATISVPALTAHGRTETLPRVSRKTSLPDPSPSFMNAGFGQASCR